MGANPGGHGTHGTHSPGRLSLRPSHHTRLRCASPWVSSGSKQEARPGRAITYRSGTRPRPSSGERREGYRACPEELCVRQGQLPSKSRVGGRAAPPGHVPLQAESTKVAVSPTVHPGRSHGHFSAQWLGLSGQSTLPACTRPGLHPQHHVTQVWWHTPSPQHSGQRQQNRTLRSSSATV